MLTFQKGRNVKSQVNEFLTETLGRRKRNQLVAVIGICKNAGKTTLLNWLLQKAGDVCLGVITTGRDGEDVDLITHEFKPKVDLPKNVIFSTFAEEIEKHTPHLVVLEKLSERAGGRNLWLAKTTQAIQAEIVGPATAEAQIKLAKHILTLGAEQVIIDGSIDRKAISLQALVDALVLVVSSSIGQEKDVLNEVIRLYNLSKLTVTLSKFESAYISYRTEDNLWKQTEYKSLLGQEREIIHSLGMVTDMNAIYFPCSLTDKGFPVLKSFLQQFEGELIVHHPLLFHISLANLNWLEKNCQIQTLKPFRLKSIAVNSYAANGKHVSSDAIRSMIRANIKKLPIIDVKEIIS